MIALAAAYLGLLFAKWQAALARIALEPQGVPWPADAEVVVLQPIRGGDPELERMLRANARALCGRARLLWLIDESDPAGNAAADAAAAGRQGVTVVRCPDSPPGVNPKLFKLQLGLERCETEFIAVLDDDTAIDAGHLAAAIAALDDADLYTGLPSYCASGSVGSALIAGFVNSAGSLTYLPPLTRAPAITLNGMFYVMRTERLRALGGFRAIEGELCDDLALAQLLRAEGLSIAQGARAQVLRTHGLSWRAYVARMHRWMVFSQVLLRRLDGGQRLRLGLELGAPPVLLWALLGAGLTHPAGWVAVPGVLLARHLALGGLLARATRDWPLDHGLPRPRLGILASIGAELLMPLHTLHAAVWPVIEWRGRRLRVRADGRFREAPAGERT